MAKLIVQMAKYSTRTFSYTPKDSLLTLPVSNACLRFSRSIATTRYLKADRLYTDNHEWIIIDGKVGTVGISNYAQEALGDIVYAQIPDIESVIEKGVECGALESVKAASEVYSPVSGKIIEKNEEVEKTPSLINSSCYEKGWLFKIELSNLDEIKKLMDENKYKLYIESNPK
ncbi:glycine cleavage system H protein, mitochondrial [Ptiloglossa arizonensis]|uniref:glycine cleavage system H protein, mitochondrial n=1 Tax=Ptiloglossa arizonensis TaxID=3350558 RepID=UPI003F9EC278